MSQRSDMNLLGDDDDERLAEKKIQPRPSHLLTKKTLDNLKTDSSKTFPYDREIYPNECNLIFFSLEGDTENARQNKDIKVLRKFSLQRETPSVDNDILITFELDNFERHFTDLNIKYRPFSDFDSSYVYKPRASRIKELIKGVSKDEKIQLKVDEYFPFFTQITSLILEQPWIGKISLRIDHKNLHAESQTKLSIDLISSHGEKRKQFDVPLEIFSFPFRVNNDWMRRRISDNEFPTNHEVEVDIESNDELQQLFQTFSIRKNFILTELRLFLQKVDFTEDEIEKLDKLKCKVERLYLRFKSANVHVLRKILDKIGPVRKLQLNIKSLSNYVDSPFQASIPFKLMLEQMEHLETLGVSDFTTPILMDYFWLTFRSRTVACSLNFVDFSNVTLHFSSLRAVEHFSEAFRQLHQLERFKLRMGKATISIESVDKNANLILLMALTSDFFEIEQIARTVKNEIASYEDKIQTQKLQYVSLSFERGFLVNVYIYETIIASSCEDLLSLCRSWCFSSSVKEVYCNTLKMECSTPECTKCSALLFLLAIRSPGKFEQSNRRHNETFLKTVRVNFSKNKFSIANVASLACQVQNMKETVDEAALSELTALSLPYLNIDFRCSEPRSRITESLAPSLCILSDSGIEVDLLKILVELDENGWGYIRIPPMDRDVRLIFSNEVKVTFPLNSLKNIASVEVHTICSDFIKRECNLGGNSSISVSPIVSIYQLGSNQFIHPITIEVPLTKVSEEGTKRLFFCRFSQSSVWECLQKSKLMEFFRDSFQYKSAYAATVFSISGKEVDIFPDSGFCKNYFSSFCYLLVYPATPPNTLVLDCVPSINEFDLNPLQVSSFFEMTKIEEVGVNDKITGFIHGNIQIESLEEETQPIHQHFEFFHPNIKRNLQEVKVHLVDKLLEQTGQVTYQKKRNDHCETSVSLNFYIPKEESIQPTTNVRICNLSTLKGTLVPSEQACLLTISSDETAQELQHSLHPFENENISIGDLVVIIDITDDSSRASFTIKCSRFDEDIREYGIKKCPAFFCVRKLPVDTLEDVHVMFTGNLQPLKTTTSESCCCSIRFSDGKGSFALINTNKSLEGVTKLMFYQKSPLGQNEHKLCEIEIKMYLFQKRHLKCWSTLSWNGEQKVVKRNVAACVESKASLLEFFSRLLPEYFIFRELIVSIYGRMEFAENELENPALNSKICHLFINLRQTNETTIDMLLKKLQNVDELNLILTDISLERRRRNVALFKTFLQPSSFSKYLTTLTICGLQVSITVDDTFDYLTDQFDAHRLHCLKFYGVHLHWNSLNKLEKFVNDMKLYSQKRGKFDFVVERTIVTISNVDRNCNLVLMMLLSSETSSCEQIQNVISSGGYYLKDRLGEETIEFLSLTYKGFILEDLELSGIVTASSCERLTELCTFWKVAPEVAHFTAKNLQMKCSDDRCEKGCSSLMFFLQNSNISRPENINYQMWNQVFSIEGMSRFNEFVAQECQEITALKTRTTADAIKLHIQCHESRHDSLLIQQQFFSNLETRGLDFKGLSILVDTDKLGWAFFKFHLNAVETEIEFSKKAIVTFPKNSTEKNKLVCIEVHPVPEEAIKQISEMEKIDACHLSPVVFLDHAESAPFLQPVTVEVPYSSTELLVFEDTLKTIAFTKHDCEESEWQTVPETSITKSIYTMKYESKEFSPFAAVTGRLLSYLNFSYFANAYFPNCVYLTILPLNCNLRNVIFDCTKTTEAELSKMKLLMPGLEFRKFGEMSFDDRIFADLKPNLRVDCYHHPGREEQRLQFFCPEHISNRQEYFMEKVNEDRAPKGVVVYSHSTAGAEVEIFHLCYSIARMQNIDNRAPVEVNRMVNANANQHAQPVGANLREADFYVEAEPVSFENILLRYILHRNCSAQNINGKN